MNDETNGRRFLAAVETELRSVKVMVKRGRG